MFPAGGLYPGDWCGRRAADGRPIPPLELLCRWRCHLLRHHCPRGRIHVPCQQGVPVPTCTSASGRHCTLISRSLGRAHPSGLLHCSGLLHNCGQPHWPCGCKTPKILPFRGLGFLSTLYIWHGDDGRLFNTVSQWQQAVALIADHFLLLEWRVQCSAAPVRPEQSQHALLRWCMQVIDERMSKGFWNAGLLSTQAGTTGRLSGNLLLSICARIGTESGSQLRQLAASMFGTSVGFMAFSLVWVMLVYRRLVG